MMALLGWTLRCNHNQWMPAAGTDTCLTLGHWSIQHILPILSRGHRVQVADSTHAVPCSSTSVMPASTITGHSQTLFLTTPLSYPGTPMPLTQLPVGAAVRAVDLEAWLGMMQDKVNKLLEASTVLCQEYSDIVEKLSREMAVAHADTLLNLNKYSVAMHVAIGKWRVDVERALQILSASPGITAYNTQVEIVRVKTNQFQEKLDTAEAAFLTSKKKTKVGRTALLEWIKTELGTRVHAAIQKVCYQQDGGGVGCSGADWGHDIICHTDYPGVCRLLDSHRPSWDRVLRIPDASVNSGSHAAVRHADYNVKASSPHVPPDISGAISMARSYAGSRHRSKRGEDRSPIKGHLPQMTQKEGSWLR